MVNGGAIAATSFVPGSDPEDRFRRILQLFSDAAGRELHVDEPTYRSESQTGNRNRAIGYLLPNAGIFDGVEQTLDLYFRQCSLLVTARDLAVMGATLANLGTNPLTGKAVLGMDAARDVLSVMLTCGMYDFAGVSVFVPTSRMNSACRCSTLPTVVQGSCGVFSDWAELGLNWFRRAGLLPSPLTFLHAFPAASRR